MNSMSSWFFSLSKIRTKLLCVLTGVTSTDEDGAIVNSVKNEGATPLYIASTEGSSELIQTLLIARADVNLTRDKGEQHTPLIAAAAAAEQLDFVKLLLKNNCDINAPDKDGWTPLWHAYGNNGEDKMKLLLKSGTDKNVRNAD